MVRPRAIDDVAQDCVASKQHAEALCDQHLGWQRWSAPTRRGLELFGRFRQQVERSQDWGGRSKGGDPCLEISILARRPGLPCCFVSF